MRFGRRPSGKLAGTQVPLMHTSGTRGRRPMWIADFLAEHQVPFETIVHAPAFTAQKRARFLHVPGRQVAKGVLLKGPCGYFLAVLPAPQHVDTEVLSAV